VWRAAGDLLDDPTHDEDALKRVNGLKKMDVLKDVRGTVLEFRRTRGFVPNTRCLQPRADPGAVPDDGGRAHGGSGISNETSEFTLRGERANGGAWKPSASTPMTAHHVRADLGPDGEKKYPRDVYGRAGLKRRWSCSLRPHGPVRPRR
jgi:hypothetical protein